MIKPTQRPTANVRRGSLAIGIACWFSLAGVTADQATAVAMQVTSSDGRSVAAPWRPSFGQVNSQAAAATNNVSGNVGAQRQLDLSPPGSTNRATAPNANAQTDSRNLSGSSTRSNTNETQPIAAQIARARSLVPPPSKAPPITRGTLSLIHI